MSIECTRTNNVFFLPAKVSTVLVALSMGIFLNPSLYVCVVMRA